MSSENKTIISAEGYADNAYMPSSSGNDFFSKKLLLIFLILISVILLTIFLAFRYYFLNREVNIIEKEPEFSTEIIETRPILPFSRDPELEKITDIATSTDLMIEYLSFSDFYKKDNILVNANFEDYSLPLNTKIDVINYYDISRKLNLDPVIDDINENGFAIINNPWSSNAEDFYSIYKNLKERQIPLFISSDFLIYYQQNVIKKAFKDIEENIFFDNLWDINKELFQRAKTRYETRLASIGSVNDPLLEASRLEAVYFAVSLELLKPVASQISPTGVQLGQDKFSVSEANRFSFVVPLSIKEDVEAEIRLIREAKQKTKSPVFLYTRDYKDFVIPSQYSSHAKLNNFFLASRWLNSTFPLYYKSEVCTDCLLDREDWRINFIASLLIADDFSSLPQIKNRWARIYKVIAFFEGLRDDLDYINYRDSLLSAFGENYLIEDIFQGTSEDIDLNLNKIVKEIEKFSFSEIQGGKSFKELELKSKTGFKVLTEYFSPDDYLLGRLVSPSVGKYLGESLSAYNNTACGQRQLTRCNASGYDIINLVYPLDKNLYFIENSNYNNYNKESLRLSNEIKSALEARTNNYWSLLASINEFLNFNKTLMPVFSKSDKWNERQVNTALSSWANMYIPLERFSINQSLSSRGLDDFSRWTENSYVEANLDLVNELISVNRMILSMLSALRIENEAKQVMNELNLCGNNLERIREIIIKEISGKNLTKDDFEFISDFSGLLEIVEPVKNKNIQINPNSFSRPMKASLNDPKLILVVNQRNGEKFFSVGPVWNYVERR